jgi:hypothetical protein
MAHEANLCACLSSTCLPAFLVPQYFSCPNARGFTRRRGFLRHLSQFRFCKWSRPAVLTHLIRRTAPLQYARRPRARNLLASSSDATTAESAVESSAGSIRPSRFVSMSLPASTLTVSCIVHAIVATVPSASGSIFVPAAPTARAPTTALQPSKLGRRSQPSDQKILAWAALLRASRAHGTGALSERAIRLSCSQHLSYPQMGPHSSVFGPSLIDV